MPINDKVLQLYKAMKADGADVGTEQEFNDYFLAQGDQGYKNRKAVYDAFKADGADVGENYEEFASWLGLRPANQTQAKPQPAPQTQPVQQTPTAAPKDTTRVATPQTTPTPQQTVNVAQASQKPTPLQLPEGFGELDTQLTRQMGAGLGPVSWEQPGVVNPQTGKAEPKPDTPVKQITKALKGDKKAAKESGLDTAVQRMQDELDYSNATGKALGEGNRYAQWEAPTVARDENGQMMVGENGQPLTGMTTDEQRAAQYQQQQREITRKQLIDPLVDNVINNIRNEGKVSPEGLLAPGEAQLYLRERNKATSPEAIMKALDEYFGTGNKEDNTPEGESRVLAHWDDKEDFTTRFLLENQDAIRESAARVGMNTDDYVMQELIPQLSNTIAERFGQQMGKEYSVKGAADYFMKRMLDSGVGALVRMGNGTTPMQSQYLSEELEKSNHGEGRDFNADWYHKFGGMVAQFLPDTPLMMIGGAAGGAAAKGLGAAITGLGAEGLGTMVATGSPFLAANVGKLTKWGGLLGHAVTSGAANMGTFMGTASMLQAMASTPVDEGYLSSIGLAGWEGAKEGAKIGTALGVLGTASGAGRDLWKTAAGRAAWAGGSFLAENQIFALSDYLADPEKFNWVDSSLDALYMQLAGKVQGLSTHGAEGIKQSWKHIFDPIPKMPTLTDAEKETVRKAFGGMSFEQIAGDMSNLEKILSDKQNIPLTIRQKISGRTLGVFEPNRPYTYKTNIRGNEIYERAKDGELINIHTFETPEERDAIMQDIADRKQHDQMVHDFISLDMQEKSAPILDGFAQEFGMTRQEVWDMMQKRPVELREDEMDLMDELGRRLHDAATPKGELHTEQSNTDGAELAGSESAMNPESAVQLSQEVDEARNVYLSAPISEDVQQAINSLGKDARLDDIYMYVRENFSGPEVDNYLAKLADYANALAKRDGFLSKTGDNIEETVQQEIDRNSFHGKLDDAPDTENLIFIDYNGHRYTILNGNIGSRMDVRTDPTNGMQVGGDRMVDPERSGGLIIASDENGNWVSLKPDANMVISQLLPKEEFANARREELGVQDTQTAVETGLVKPEGEPKPTIETPGPKTASKDLPEGVGEGPMLTAENGGIRDNAEGEAGAENGTGANEPSATAISKIPTLKDEKGADILDEEGDPQYQWEQAPLEDTLNALAEISGGDPNTVRATVDSMLNEAQKAVEKADKLTPKGKDPIKIARSAAEIKAQQEDARRKLEYWTQAKQELEKVNKPETNLNVESSENNQPENVVPLQPKVASEQQEEQNKPSLKSRLQKLAERYKKKFGEYFNDDIDVPGDATELVALNIGTGRQFRWEDKPDGTRGFKTALGIETEFGGRRGSEGHAFAHLFKGKDDTTGLGFDEFVDKVWRSDENTIHGLDGNDTKRFTEQQIGDAIIDLFMSAEQGKDITEYIIRNRVEKAQKGWEAEQEHLKDLARQKEKVTLTEEEVANLDKHLPFEKPVDGDDIPDSPITKLSKEAERLMEEEGTPKIDIHDTDRMSDKQWYDLVSDLYEGAFVDEELVKETKETILGQKVFYDEKTGRIKVFSSDITADELREKVEQIKKHIEDDRVQRQEREASEDILPAGTEDGSSRPQEGEAGKGGNDGEGKGGPESIGESRRKSESSERDEYLKPRNEKEKQIVSDVEAKLAEEIKAAEEEVKKAKSAYEKARTKESDKATDIFADDKAFEEPDQLFSFDEMGGTDRSQEGVNRRTEEVRERLIDAQAKLDKLQSKSEHDSRVRGALDNERRQTSFDEIDERHKEEYDKYIKPLLDRSDEELEQLAKEKEDAVGGDLKKLEGDKEYSSIKIVQLQREVDRQNESVRKHKEKVNSRENLEKKKANLTEQLEETEAILKEHPKDQKAQESADRLRERIEEIDEKLKSLASNPIDAIEKAAQEFNEERKQEQKELGIITDETPEQKADRERAEKLADTPLTDSEVDSSSASDVQKTLAKAYLNGNHGLLQEAAYLNVYNDVRNRRQISEADRLNAGGEGELAGKNDTGESGLGRVGEQAGRLASESDVSGQEPGEPQPERVHDTENSKVDVPEPSVERGSGSIPESEPSRLDGVHSGSELSGRGSGDRSDGHNVRQPSTEGGGSKVAGEAGRGKDNAPAGSDAAIAASKQRLAELRKKFKDAGRNGTLSVSLIGMNSEQIGVLGEIITESANLGYQYISKGMRDFNEWRKQMLSDFKDWLQEDFKWTDSDVEEYLREVWNCEYNIDGVTRTIGEWASFIGEKELKKVVKSDRGTKFEQQKAAESVETKVGDIDNIRESLPFLLPEQQDDVYKAETQFFSEEHQDRAHGNGKGMMFTNGTGTGKTYTGLGIVKRFVKQGKGRVLILTPSQEKVTDWANDGLNLGLKIEKLDDVAKETGTTATKSKGKGVVVTTYANARQNLAMLEDCFDLIVYDESHKITEGKEAAEGEMFKFHQMLTNKDVEKSMDRQTYWLPEWIEYRNLLKEREENRKTLDMLGKMGELSKEQEELQTRLNARMPEIEKRFEELRPIMQEIRESKRPQAEIDSKRTKTVFLSATPFNRRENLKYAEGYLFSYPEEDKNTIGSYNHRSPEDAFLEQMFPAGYRWRYGRLESHVSNAEALGRQEIDFSDYLQNTLQTMSGRMISSDYDYSRDFPVLTLDHAGRFNQAMSEVYRNKRYQPLAEAFRKSFDYNYSTALFEAMKTSLVNERIKEHLKRGQKVVVFHRRRTSGDLEPPFRRALEAARVQASMEQDGNTKTKILNAIKAFEEDFADMLEWEKTLDYTLPREQIEKVFGKDRVAFFSGAETKKTKHQSVEDFMKDNGGKDIIVIQEASGKEGISLHDQTGEHQRVEINLALPQSPIAFIQIEGRIYRIGQKSNAIFEYPLLGLDLETNLFAQKFNGALGTTENLALGSKARNLRKSIANSVLENTGEVDYERQGLGGKDMDGRVNEAGDKDGFDVSIQDYYGNQKMQRGRDNREGVDYFPTPEPVGYKMVEWGQMMDGETALEPSAGHGAIARYVPETNGMTAIEPSASLFTKLQMRAGGPGRRFEEMTFEDYPLANKHDVVLMNPPYGVGGKTAMEHVAKAFKHLNEGGRLIAIIPDGPAMDKRLEAWLNSSGSEGLNGAAVVVGEVKLPDVAFGRAGTNVRTRIVVIDKVTRAQMREKMPQKVEVDLSNEESIGGLFDKIRNVRMPERTIDQVAINEKRAKRTEKQFDENPFVTDVYIGKLSYADRNVLKVSTKAGGTSLDIDLDLANVSEDYILDKYESLKAGRDNPENLDYGRWARKSFGSGKNKVPALDAIRDYCDTAIKTLENISRLTADQMERMSKERKEAVERRRIEMQAEADRLREERKRQQEEKLKPIVETALAENSDNPSLTPAGIEYNLKIAHGNIYLMAEKAKRILKDAGIDWQTGHKINKNEPVNARTSTVVSQQPTQRKADYEYKLDKNTRTGENMHLVNYGGARLSDADYRAIERKAKANDGYYNRFKKAWHFKTEEDARKFIESVNASEGTPTTRFRSREADEDGPFSRFDFEKPIRLREKNIDRDLKAIQANEWNLPENVRKVVEKKLEEYMSKKDGEVQDIDVTPYFGEKGETTAKDALEYISKNSTDKDIQKLAKYLLDNLGDNENVSVSFREKRDGVRGQYFPTNHTVRIRRSAARGMDEVSARNNLEQTVIHEIAHAVTVRFLENGSPEARNEILQIYKDYKGLYNQYEIETGYADKNPKDFVAEFLGRKAFREALMELPSSDKNKSIGQKILDFIKKHIFRMKETDTFFKQADDAIKKVMDMANKGDYPYGDEVAEDRDIEEKLNNKYKDEKSEDLFLSLSQKEGEDLYESAEEINRRVESGDARIVRLGEEAERGRRTAFHRIASLLAGNYTDRGSSRALGEISEESGREGIRFGSKRESDQEKTRLLNQKIAERVSKAVYKGGKLISEAKAERDSLDGKKYASASESNVYRTPDGKHVVKFTVCDDNSYDNSLLKRLDDMALFNTVFPDSAYDVIGLASNGAGRLKVVSEQPYFEGETAIAHFKDSNKAYEFIDNYLENTLKLKPLKDEEGDTYAHTKGDLIIRDVNYENVIIDKEGNPHVIDCQVERLDDTGRERKGNFSVVDTNSTRMRSRDGENSIETDFERKRKAGEKLAKKLNSDFEAVTELDQIQNKEVRDAIAAGHEVPGWIEIGKDGKKKIFMYLPHVRDTYDAEKTIAHEVIGHQGMRELLGEKGYKSYCRALLYDLKDPELQKYWMENLAKNGFDTYRTIDEFLAEAAEKGYGDLTMWQKVKNAMTDALRSAGFTMSPSISDVKYMVWLSKHNLEKGNVINRIEREALLYRLGRERYEAKVRNGEFTEEQKALEGGNDVPYFPGEGKTLFRHTPSVKNQRRNYERALKRAVYVWKEAHVDAMQSAIELTRAISGHKKIEEIPSAENFVLLENQMSSKEEQMDFLFNRDYMKPLDDAVSRCLPDMGKGIDEQLKNLQLYMIKKHGLERNRVLYVRDAIRDLRKDSSADQQQVDDMEKDYNDTMRDLRDDLRNGTIDLKEYFEEVDKWISNNIPEYKAGEKDYSGLTDLYGKGYKEADIIDEVMSTEAMLGDERVNNLWEKTNAVSKFGLDMEYEGGLDSKEKHDKVSDMFEWYVPLRGYDEKTAEEVYDYLEEHGNDRKWAGPVLMNAKGRESLADVDVFATMGAMSSSAINRSLRNQMKQAFARFVRNHYNDVDANNRLVTELPYLWAEKQHDPITGADVWVEKFPDIPENAKADDIAAILDQYEQDMKAKEASGDAKRVRQNSNIPFRPAKAEHKSQHIVDVWINGEKHAFIVNGNPRAAQAINGQLKAERNSNILWLSSLSHFMAKMNTSYSPDFIMRNTERDLIYSAANIAVKENFEYWVKWAKNYGVATGRVAAGVPAMHTNLFKRYRDGKLNMANSTDRYFKEFMENGGETGWVERKNLDKWKKAIKQGVKAQGSLEKAGNWLLNVLPDAIEAMNERAENMARFATYMTSREMGRSITRSVSDAKEVSVNFNRKGAGRKTVDLNKGDNSWLRNANAYMAGWSAQNLQDYIMFYNAGVQGMTNMIKNVANHPIKGTTAFAAFALAGMLMPQLNQHLFEEDDDKTGKEPENPYAELPEYVRRNNLCIYNGKGSFITIALPIELRAMYGIGDMAASYINHPELRSTKNAGEDIVTQLSQVAPLDFFGEGAGPMWAMVPSGVRPFAEAAANKNWLGQPIERDEERWNQNKPRWTRAFKNVGDAYVGASKRLNAATNPYNDENIKGWADGAITDPALVEHIVNGYFGGVGSTVNRVAQLAKHADEMSPKEAITSNWMPIVRTQHYTPNERTRYARTRNKWWYYKEEADKTQETIKVLKKRGEHDPVSFMQSVSEEEGKKGTRAKIMERAYKNYTKVKKKMEKTDDLQQKDIYQLQMDQIMEGAVKELDKIQ